MNISEAIFVLEDNNKEPTNGMPEEIFEYISRHTPIVNVDLLIKDKQNRTLLSWRNDKYCNRGWHIPGRIIRFRETFENAIINCAKNEIGTNTIIYKKYPIDINEIFNPVYDTRGHFVSLLYECQLPSTFVPRNHNLSETSVGFLKWHESCPENLIKIQDIYRRFI